MFENAAVIDPSFASPYAGLAEAFSSMYEWYDGNSKWLSKAIDINQKALALEPSSLEAKFGIAMVYFHQRRFAESKRSLEAILGENPEFFPAYMRLAMIADSSRDLEAALKYYRRAAELKPYNEDPWVFLVEVYRKLGNVAAAEEAAVKVIELSARKLEASADDVIVMSRLAEAYARFASREEANAALTRALELEPNDGLALYNCACTYALLGDSRASLILLRRAYDSGFRTVGHWAKTDSAFETLHNDQEFQQVVAELQ